MLEARLLVPGNLKIMCFKRTFFKITWTTTDPAFYSNAEFLSTATLGTKEAQSKYLLGRVFEYLLLYSNCVGMKAPMKLFTLCRIKLTK